MQRMWAIVERELRKFLRSPALMLVSMVFPLVQLMVLGSAFGGKIRDARLGVVDQDGGTQALKIREAFDSVQATARTFRPIYYSDDRQAMEDVRNGKLDGAVVIPPQFSRRMYEQEHPRIALIVDNSDNVMIGGGMLYIDDKARGIHEGYLVTPITKTELVLGLNVAGAIKAVGAGIVITFVGSLVAGVGNTFRPDTFLWLLLMILVTSLAFNTMMFLMMVRVEDPLVPRAIFGVLNTLLFFPSGSIYPIKAFPPWLKAIAIADPFTYAVHGFKALLLKEAGFTAIWQDMLFLTLFAILMISIATPLFKRTL